MERWLTYREVSELYGIKRAALYGRISKLVRVRDIPGDSRKWLQADLDKLVKKHTREPLPEIEPNRRKPPGQIPVSKRFLD